MVSSIIIPFAPILALVGFGIYSLVVILYNLATFPQCKPAAQELVQQIKEAKADLKKKGISISDK